MKEPLGEALGPTEITRHLFDPTWKGTEFADLAYVPFPLLASFLRVSLFVSPPAPLNSPLVFNL